MCQKWTTTSFKTIKVNLPNHGVYFFDLFLVKAWKEVKESALSFPCLSFNLHSDHVLEKKVERYELGKKKILAKS